MFEYEIAGKKYIQKPIVLGQIRQLTNLLKGMSIPENADALGLIAALGDKLSDAIAIVVTPEDMKLKNKNIKSIAQEIEFELSPELAIQVVEDFFTCNPIASLLERLGGVAERLTVQMSKTGLKKPVLSSQVETSQSEMSSSGDIPLQSVSLT